MSAIRRIITLAVISGALALAGVVLSCGNASADSGVNWDAIAQCESGGKWGADSGNGFYGGLQFKQATWAANGGVGTPHQASREEQIRVAENVMQKQGLGAWPSCSKNAGAPGFAVPVSSGTTAAPAQAGCQNLGRGPLGLIDFGKMCQALTDPGKAVANALGIH
ncbi:transglycosylase family protein [Candidatus Mycolicibacterium alkanivorans]|uniref:Transglycosylase family protein n=1 Tax=Candidatus Mycolicibacterium alkanivorans TaxID=2954114 RepID=A0ABS9YXZ1_9MYCO|nr:transglycosylase family protein [Candidatus Mycolicibacterium alkanivorans]MCI4675204.1 transglycosylase family protein [Candidatus Mycolicibacterium alkanivorans]